MKHIPKLIFAAGAAALGGCIFALYTRMLPYGNSDLMAATMLAIGLLVTAGVAEYLFCRPASE